MIVGATILKTYLLISFLDNYFAFHNGIFYLANKHELKLFELIDNLNENEVRKVKVNSKNVATIIAEDHIIHGLFME